MDVMYYIGFNTNIQGEVQYIEKTFRIVAGRLMFLFLWRSC